MAHYGVVIGCSRYDDPRIADLKYAHEDAVRFATNLTAVAGVAENAITVLHDGAGSPRHVPTRSNVLRAVTALANTSEPIDTLHFFFSGHGYHSWNDGSDYLLVNDSISEAFDQTSLQFGLLVQLLQNSGARHTVLYLDACRSATAGGKSLDSPMAQVQDLSPPGMVSFCSCAPGDVSYESDELGGGVFTAALLEALSESGQCVTVQDVDDYLHTAIPVLSHRAGKPAQHAHTRVEPLTVRDLEIVEPRIRTAWSAQVRLGVELRPARSRTGPPLGLDDPIVAIDFGTSYSAAAFSDSDGTVQLIKSVDQRVLTPSVVSFTDDLDYRVGSRAVEMEIHQPTSSIRHVKRQLGTGSSVQLGNRYLTPEVVTSLVIRSLKTAAEESLGRPVRRCIASYPANFGIRQTNALLRAFELAGLTVERMVGEPNIATTLLYAERPDIDEATVLIVDLGGGTFDVAVAELGDGVAEIRSVGGNNELGGIDYDEAILGFVRRRLVEQHSGLILPDDVVSELRREAERAKRALTTHEQATLVVHDLETDDGLRDVEVVLTRDDLRTTVRHLDDEIARIVRSVLDDAHVAPTDIDLVLLSGQGAKIVTVAEVLRNAVPGVEVIDRYQELAVVRGLALQVGVLTGTVKDILLLDLTHHAIGFRAQLVDDGSAFHKISNSPDHTETMLTKHETIPCYRKETYVFSGPDDELMLTIVEDAGSKDIEIGVIRFPAPGPEVVLTITIDTDANSSLILSVHDRTNGVYRSFQLNHHHRDPVATVRATTPVLTRPTIKISYDGQTVDNAYPPNDRYSPDETEQNDVRLARSRLAINTRQPATAIRLLYQVMTVGPGDQQEARTLSRHVCNALAASPESHRAPVITDLVRTLVTYWRANRPEPSALHEEISRIQRLGDFPPIRDLEALLNS